MTRLELWWVILGMGIISFVLRGSFILFSDRLVLPEGLKRALRFVPAAVLAAIIMPAVFYTETGLSVWNERVIAAVAAAIVAWRSKNIVLTLVVGMAVLWLLQWAVDTTGCVCFSGLE